MSTALVSVGALVREGRDLMKSGDDYYAQAGAKFSAAREAAGGFTLQYRAALVKAGVSERMERRAIEFGNDPVKAQLHRQKEVVRAKDNRGRTYDRNTAKQNNNLPGAVSKGELHEATRGFKAMIRKGAMEKDIQKSHERRTVAFQHFKLLLTNSNLPGLMGMTPDEIIQLIRTI